MDRQLYKEFHRHVNVSRETFNNLVVYYNLLCEWQKKMNLVSNQSLSHAFERHFLDSAQIFECCTKMEGNILDFGTGAGFPGLVLAIMGIKNIHLVDSNKKKCNFLNEVLYKTRTNSTVHNCRIECLPYLKPSLIMARALAPTQKLLTLCMDYMIRGNSNYSKKDALKNMPNLLFLKGKSYVDELASIQFKSNIKFMVLNSITNKEGKILFYKNKKNRNNV